MSTSQPSSRRELLRKSRSPLLTAVIRPKRSVRLGLDEQERTRTAEAIVGGLGYLAVTKGLESTKFSLLDR